MSLKQRNALPIIVIIHGLGDSMKTPYVKRLARACHRSGWRVVAYSYWRCDFGCTKDLKKVMQHLNNKYPESAIVGCGLVLEGTFYCDILKMLAAIRQWSVLFIQWCV